MVKYLIMDVDGTLTDGKIYMSDSGEFIKAFNIKDGAGIHDILISSGIIPVVITGRSSDIVNKRCKELGITEVHQGVKNKMEKLISVVKGPTKLHTVAYIGDDINDLSCMQSVKDVGGVVGCPADAVQKIKDIADFIAPHNGGEGAVRDFIEWIIDKGKA